jgi:hypothetical protein
VAAILQQRIIMVSAPWVKLRTALLTVFDYISVCILSTAGALWAFITQGRHRHPTEYVLAGGIQWLCRWGTLGACRSAQHLLQEIAYPRLLQAMRKRELAIEEYYSKSNDSAPEVKGLWLRKPGSKPDILILEVHGMCWGWCVARLILTTSVRDLCILLQTKRLHIWPRCSSAGSASLESFLNRFSMCAAVQVVACQLAVLAATCTA